MAVGSSKLPELEDNEGESEDELDKFMASIDVIFLSYIPLAIVFHVQKQLQEEKNGPGEDAKSKAKRVDLEEEDDEESYYNYVKNTIITQDDDDEDVEYDDDGFPIQTKIKREIAPLPSVDHSEIKYSDYQTNFYVEHEEIKNLDSAQIEKIRLDFKLKVSGLNIPNPVASFAHFGFDEYLMDVIRKHEYVTPTAIQSQGIPIILSGRDLIGIAKTGSGKTAAYLLPMMVHVIAQQPLEEGDGPIALVLAPTRELVQQIYVEAKKFAKSYNLTVCAVFGGGNKYEQGKALKEGIEICICTPGRLIDLIKSDCTNLKRVTMLVMDEADRMFDLGFETQVRSISSSIRPDRQCLLFSATFKKKIEKLCREMLNDPIRVITGEIGEASEDVLQIVQIFKDQDQKWTWLSTRIAEFCSVGSLLIFVTKKGNCEELAARLKLHPAGGQLVGVIHGDFTQFERDEVMKSFRSGNIKILVATDVAARGLDIFSIKNVVNYDVARDITTHTHRIGRTGRAGEKGVAYTLVLPSDAHIIPDLVRNLEGANQKVPQDLLQLALNNPWFKKMRSKHHSKDAGSSSTLNKSVGTFSTNFKPRERLGLGFHKPTPMTSEEASSGSYKVHSILSDVDTKYLIAEKDNPVVISKPCMPSIGKPQPSVFQDRAQILRSAYSTGYARFQKATTLESPNVPTNISNQSEKRKFEDIPTSNDSVSEPKKRKSRWN